MSKILVIGSINQDIVAKVDHLPQKGETILSESGEHFFGGKGANQAIACAKLGGDCDFIGKIGNDSFGESYLKNFQVNNVRTNGVLTSSKVGTGLAIITVDKNANNSIVVMQNANKDISVEDVISNETLIDSCDYILLQLEIPIEVVEAVIDIGYKKGKKIILNPAPAKQLNPALFNKLYALTPNENEAYQILNKAINKVDSIESRMKSLANIGKDLLGLGAENVIITLGCDGVMHLNESQIYHYSSYSVNADDTTGAGDTFNGALAYYLSQGYSFPEAIVNSQAAAALCTLKLGAQTAMPTQREVSEFVCESGSSERMLINV